MRTLTYVYAWSCAVALAGLASCDFLTNGGLFIPLLVPPLLWVALVVSRFMPLWWLLVCSHAIGMIYFLDQALSHGRSDVWLFILVFTGGMLALLQDPPTRWHGSPLPGRAAALEHLSPTEQKHRREFLHWWAHQSVHQREAVWMRLTSQERLWALEEMAPDARTVYSQIERAHKARG